MNGDILSNVVCIYDMIIIVILHNFCWSIKINRFRSQNEERTKKSTCENNQILNLTRKQVMCSQKIIHTPETHVCLLIFITKFNLVYMVMWEYSGLCAKLWHTITSFYGAWRVGRGKIYDYLFLKVIQLKFTFFFILARALLSFVWLRADDVLCVSIIWIRYT